MDTGMWKCHCDYHSADLWFRASCQGEMPSCYLHSFKRSEKTVEMLERKKKGKGAKTSASGNLAEYKNPAEPSKILSPTAGKIFSKMSRTEGHPLLTAGLVSSPCSLQPDIWEDRCKEMLCRNLERNTLILRCPGPPRKPEKHKASNKEPVCRSWPGYVLSAAEQEGFSP